MRQAAGGASTRTPSWPYPKLRPTWPTPARCWSAASRATCSTF
jgi:hypothetical protein